jgi:inosine-uridine nucleoside N-ribohydrolase
LDLRGNNELAGIPIILDTDIGVDVDDVWALAMMLRSPELDVRLITTTTGDTVYAAKIVAKLLEAAGRTDIPIGIGIPLQATSQPHADWVKGYDLANYPGEVLRDGVGAITDAIRDSKTPVTVVGIGPLPNIAAALQRDPGMTANSRFVGMHGSIRRGYLGLPKPMAEYNVKQFTKASQAVFSADWDFTLTPLDTCGTVTLSGERFAKVRDSEDPLTAAVIENHRLWVAQTDIPHAKEFDSEKQSSTLYDTVAIYLAFSEELLVMESLRVLVNEKGQTRIDESGQPMRCAMDWKDYEAFQDLLVKRLTETPAPNGAA